MLDQIDSRAAELDENFGAGMDSLNAGDFQSAAGYFDSAYTLGEEVNRLVESAGAKAKTEEGLKRLEEHRELVPYRVIVPEAYGQFAVGQASKQGRDPGAAVESFNRASELFTQLSELDRDPGAFVLAEYALINIDIANGLEELIRGDTQGAKSHFMRAKVAMERLAGETIPALAADVADATELDSLRARLQVDLIACNTLLHVAGFRDETARGNWSAALREADAVVELEEQQLAALPEEFPKALRGLVESELHTVRAQREMMRGQVLKGDERWDEAVSAYLEAREELNKAAEAILRSGHPQAGAMQESLMNQASTGIDLAIEQCQTERQLKEQIAKLEAEVAKLEAELDDQRETLMHSLEKLGLRDVHITTVAEATARVENRIEISVEQLVTGLADAAERSELDPETKRRIVEGANEVLAEKGKPGFMERAKKFASDVADVVKNAAEAAAPLIPVAKALAGMLGVALVLL